MTRLVKEGSRRALLWVNDLLMGLRTHRQRVRRSLNLDDAEMHTMPSAIETEEALRLFSRSFPYPSEVRVLRRLARTCPWACVVLVVDGSVAGYCFFRLLPRKRAVLLSTAVDQPHRGRGYGRALMSFALGLLKDAGTSNVELDVEQGNERAIRLYSALGFTIASVHDRKSLRMGKAL